MLARWSNDAPDADVIADLRTCFVRADAHVVSFTNFLIDDETLSTIYVAHDPVH